MRRKDREVLGDENIAKIIEQCTTYHIAMVTMRMRACRQEA
jgi:nitroimidazol reductase NimA-like FMN-containing flavoprotein (pyridoxamine 5'-phosphate oxidase superfamily)